MVSRDRRRTKIEGVPMRSVAAELRPLMEVIDRKMREGAALVDIQKALNEDGLEVSFENLRWNLRQYRRRIRENGEGKVTAELAEKDEVAPPIGDNRKSEETLRERQGVKPTPNDDVPLTRARLREIRKRPFNWETMNQRDGAKGNDE